MILKFRDNNNVWNWIDKVDKAKRLPFMEDSQSEYPPIIIGDGNDPLFMDLSISDNDYRLYVLNVSEAYLCNESNGSTIDVLVSPNG
jgi:hypothetical protein